MTLEELTEHERQILKQRCTEAQLEAVERYDRGHGIRAIAAMLQISPTAVRDRLEAARRHLHHAREDNAA